MGLGSLFRQLFRRSDDGPLTERTGPSEAERDAAGAWLDAFEAGRLHPPRNVHDAKAWDDYWRNHLMTGLMEQAFSDAMSSAHELPALLRARGARTVLCAGNGLSTEALSLATQGFAVTALDISSVPAELMNQRPIDALPLANMHGDGPAVLHPGGCFNCVTGDLMDPSVCPGPFDVVIERRTVQLMPEHERRAAFDRLVSRLATDGVFVSQQHVGGWRPGEPRDHYAAGWLNVHGFSPYRRHDSAPRESRLAWLIFSTG